VRRSDQQRTVLQERRRRASLSAASSLRPPTISSARPGDAKHGSRNSRRSGSSAGRDSSAPTPSPRSPAARQSPMRACDAASVVPKRTSVDAATIA
jgi:hypothetical protein